MSDDCQGKFALLVSVCSNPDGIAAHFSQSLGFDVQFCLTLPQYPVNPVDPVQLTRFRSCALVERKPHIETGSTGQDWSMPENTLNRIGNSRLSRVRSGLPLLSNRSRSAIATEMQTKRLAKLRRARHLSRAVLTDDSSETIILRSCWSRHHTAQTAVGAIGSGASPRALCQAWRQ